MDTAIIVDLLDQADEVKTGVTTPITTPQDGLTVAAEALKMKQAINQRFYDQSLPLPYPEAGLP